jgi:hypothetical protein
MPSKLVKTTKYACVSCFPRNRLDHQYVCFLAIPVQGKWRPINMTSKANNLILSDDEVAGVLFVDALG